jgi:hypothetical protein
MRLREAAQANSKGRLALRVDVGLESACVTTRDHDVICFGRGYGRTFRESDALHDSREVALSARDCAITSDATVWCWGGVLPEWWWSSSQVPPPMPSLVGRRIDPARSAYGFTSMFPLGIAHARRWSDRGDGGCAVLDDGGVRCVGYGLAPEVGSDAWHDVTSVALPKSIDIALGEHHACALGVDGRVRCWGVGDPAATRAPGKDVGLDRVVAIRAGARFVCALRDDGSPWCWGDAPRGGLGLGPVTHTDAPQVVPNVDAIDLAVGPTHVCAVTRARDVKCWGNDGAGQLGNGTQIDASTPSSVVGLDDAVQVSVGTSASCAVTQTGALWCWGIFDRADGPWKTPVHIAL